MIRSERRRPGRRSASRAGSALASARDRRVRWLPPVLITAAGIAAFASSLDGTFVFDDIGHIVDTTNIRDLWSSFSGPRPVVRFTFGLNYALGGLETSGYHVFNIVVHLLAALALFGVVRRTLELIDRPGHLATAAPWLALSVALLWVVHPLQTQAVTYIIQRSESMMGLLYLLTLYTFIRGATSPRGGPWFLASIVACGLGMACKEVMVTAPFMVLLYDALFLAGSFRMALRRRWVIHVALAATWGVLVQCGILKIFDPEYGGNVGFGYDGVSWLEYGRTQPEVILHYVKLAAWPRHLCLDYMWPVQERWGVFAAAASVLVVLAIATIVLVVRGRPLGYLFAWFFVILAPTSSFIPVRDLAFEHRMYLPLATLLMVGVLAVDALLRFVVRRQGMSEGARRLSAAVIVVLVTVAFAARSAVRNRDYTTLVRAWQAVIEQRPQNGRAHQNLGDALFAAGRFDEAFEHSRLAIAINPTRSTAHINLGNVSLQRGDLDEAIGHYETAIRVDPNNATNSAIAKNNLGSLHVRRGDLEIAEELYAGALQSDPTNIHARFSLGRLLEIRGDHDGALREYNVVLQLDPSHQRALDRVSALSR